VKAQHQERSIDFLVKELKVSTVKEAVKPTDSQLIMVP
jgi:hypothetical protein